MSKFIITVFILLTSCSSFLNLEKKIYVLNETREKINFKLKVGNELVLDTIIGKSYIIPIRRSFYTNSLSKEISIIIDGYELKRDMNIFKDNHMKITYWGDTTKIRITYFHPIFM